MRELIYVVLEAHSVHGEGIVGAWRDKEKAQSAMLKEALQYSPKKDLEIYDGIIETGCGVTYTIEEVELI